MVSGTHLSVEFSKKVKSSPISFTSRIPLSFQYVLMKNFQKKADCFGLSWHTISWYYPFNKDIFNIRRGVDRAKRKSDHSTTFAKLLPILLTRKESGKFNFNFSLWSGKAGGGGAIMLNAMTMSGNICSQYHNRYWHRWTGRILA
jgi:hypothetical protein